MSRLKDPILETIKSKNIRPLSKINTRMRAYSKWLPVAIFGILASLTISVDIFLIQEADWLTPEIFNRNPVTHILLTLPYLWLVVTAICLLCLFFAWRNTNYGYRVTNTSLIISLSVFIISFGFVLFSLRLGDSIEYSLEKNQLYENLVNHSPDRWQKPEQGLLIGVITNIESDTLFIEDWTGDEWEVSTTENTYLYNSFTPEMHKPIKITGKIIRPGTFHAASIKPWAYYPLQTTNFPIRP